MPTCALRQRKPSDLISLHCNPIVQKQKYSKTAPGKDSLPEGCQCAASWTVREKPHSASPHTENTRHRCHLQEHTGWYSSKSMGSKTADDIAQENAQGRGGKKETKNGKELFFTFSTSSPSGRHSSGQLHTHPAQAGTPSNNMEISQSCMKSSWQKDCSVSHGISETNWSTNGWDENWN